jgi:hypothetical protein
MNKVLKYCASTVFIASGFIILLGIPTAMIPTPWFIRMNEPTILDYSYLILESIMAGMYLTLSYIQKERGMTGKCAVGGGILGFLAFACPTCNKLLVLLFGTGLLINYFRPMQPYVGFIGLVLLGVALYIKIQQVKNTHEQ